MRADWQDFYETMAKAIGSHNGQELYELIRNLAGSQVWLGYMHFEDAALWQKRRHSLDPFTVMAIFNRGQSDQHREEIANVLADAFGIKLKAPECYHGIPYIDPRRSVYDGASEMWNLFRAASGLDGKFADAWDAAINVRGNGLGTLSIGLFWIRPDLYIAVDRISSPYIHEITGLSIPHDKCSGQEYVAFMEALAKKLKPKAINYPELAFGAWQEAHGGADCPDK